MLAGIYWVVNTAGLYAAETNLWEDRRTAATRHRTESFLLASRPNTAAPPGSVAPSAGPLASPLSESHFSLPNAGLPSGARKALGWLPELVSPFGEIRDIHWGGPQSPLVIHIQDAHDVEEAQRNIQGLVDALVGKGRVRWIGLEGASGPLIQSRFRDLPYREGARAAFDVALRLGYVGGAEAAALAHDRASLWGVEDPDLYLENLAAFEAGERSRSEDRAWIDRATLAAEAAARKWYGTNLKEFEVHRAAHETGQEPLSRWLPYLWARRPDTVKAPHLARLRAVLQRESSLDFAAAERERNDLAELLARSLSPQDARSLLEESLRHRLGGVSFSDYYRFLTSLCGRHGVSLARYPVLKKYIDYVREAEGVDASSVLKELAVLEEAVERRLAATPEERAAAAARRDLAALARLIRREMTPTEWAAYMNRPPDSSAVLAALAELSGQEVPTEDIPGRTSAEAYCRAALGRNEALARNLLQKMGREGDPAAVLVAGGFHTEGLTESLRGLGASYVVLAPRIQEAPRDHRPLDAIVRDPLPLEQLLQGDVIRLATPRLGSALPQSIKEIAPRTRAYIERAWAGVVSLSMGIQAVFGLALDGRVPNLEAFRFLKTQGFTPTHISAEALPLGGEDSPRVAAVLLTQGLDEDGRPGAQTTYVIAAVLKEDLAGNPNLFQKAGLDAPVFEQTRTVNDRVLVIRVFPTPESMSGSLRAPWARWTGETVSRGLNALAGVLRSKPVETVEEALDLYTHRTEALAGETGIKADDLDHIRAHALETTDLAALLGERLNVAADDLEALRLAAAVHDLGKLEKSSLKAFLDSRTYERGNKRAEKKRARFNSHEEALSALAQSMGRSLSPRVKEILRAANTTGAAPGDGLDPGNIRLGLILLLADVFHAAFDLRRPYKMREWAEGRLPTLEGILEHYVQLLSPYKADVREEVRAAVQEVEALARSVVSSPEFLARLQKSFVDRAVEEFGKTFPSMGAGDLAARFLVLMRQVDLFDLFEWESDSEVWLPGLVSRTIGNENAAAAAAAVLQALGPEAPARWTRPLQEWGRGQSLRLAGQDIEGLIQALGRRHPSGLDATGYFVFLQLQKLGFSDRGAAAVAGAAEEVISTGPPLFLFVLGAWAGVPFLINAAIWAVFSLLARRSFPDRHRERVLIYIQEKLYATRPLAAELAFLSHLAGRVRLSAFLTAVTGPFLIAAFNGLPLFDPPFWAWVASAAASLVVATGLHARHNYSPGEGRPVGLIHEVRTKRAPDLWDDVAGGRMPGWKLKKIKLADGAVLRAAVRKGDPGVPGAVYIYGGGIASYPEGLDLGTGDVVVIERRKEAAPDDLLTQNARDIVEGLPLLAKQGVAFRKGICLVGHSMGAHVAAEIAVMNRSGEFPRVLGVVAFSWAVPLAEQFEDLLRSVGRAHDFLAAPFRQLRQPLNKIPVLRPLGRWVDRAEKSADHFAIATVLVFLEWLTQRPRQSNYASASLSQAARETVELRHYLSNRFDITLRQLAADKKLRILVVNNPHDWLSRGREDNIRATLRLRRITPRSRSIPSRGIAWVHTPGNQPHMYHNPQSDPASKDLLERFLGGTATRPGRIGNTHAVTGVKQGKTGQGVVVTLKPFEGPGEETLFARLRADWSPTRLWEILEPRLLPGSALSGAPLLNAIAEESKSLPVQTRRFSERVGNIRGMAFSGAAGVKPFIALHDDLFNGPPAETALALLHEWGHVLAAKGKLLFQWDGKLVNNLNPLLNVTVGNISFSIPLTHPDAIDFCKVAMSSPVDDPQGMRAHYFLRALQLQLFGSLDESLTRSLRKSSTKKTGVVLSFRGAADPTLLIWIIAAMGLWILFFQPEAFEGALSFLGAATIGGYRGQGRPPLTPEALPRSPDTDAHAALKDLLETDAVRATEMTALGGGVGVRRVRVRTKNDPNSHPQSPHDVLRFVLWNAKAARLFENETAFDYVYDTRDAAHPRLLAVYPGRGHHDDLAVGPGGLGRFVDFRPYDFVPPSDLSSEAQWENAVAEFRKLHNAETSGALLYQYEETRYDERGSPRFPDWAAVNDQAFVFAVIDGKDRYEAVRFNPLTDSGGYIPAAWKRVAGPAPTGKVEQVLLPVFPTAYDPVVNQYADRSFLLKIHETAEPQDTALVIGPGPCVDLWLVLLKKPRTIDAFDVNPFVVAGANLLLRRGGYSPTAFVGDAAAVLKDGNKLPDRKYRFIAWGMPWADRSPQAPTDIRGYFDGGPNGARVLGVLLAELPRLSNPETRAVFWNHQTPDVADLFYEAARWRGPPSGAKDWPVPMELNIRRDSGYAVYSFQPTPRVPENLEGRRTRPGFFPETGGGLWRRSGVVLLRAAALFSIPLLMVVRGATLRKGPGPWGRGDGASNILVWFARMVEPLRWLISWFQVLAGKTRETILNDFTEHLRLKGINPRRHFSAIDIYEGVKLSLDRFSRTLDPAFDELARAHGLDIDQRMDRFRRWEQGGRTGRPLLQHPAAMLGEHSLSRAKTEDVLDPLLEERPVWVPELRRLTEVMNEEMRKLVGKHDASRLALVTDDQWKQRHPEGILASAPLPDEWNGRGPTASLQAGVAEGARAAFVAYRLRGLAEVYWNPVTHRVHAAFPASHGFSNERVLQLLAGAAREAREYRNQGSVIAWTAWKGRPTLPQSKRLNRALRVLYGDGVGFSSAGTLLAPAYWQGADYSARDVLRSANKLMRAWGWKTRVSLPGAPLAVKPEPFGFRLDRGSDVPEARETPAAAWLDAHFDDQAPPIARTRADYNSDFSWRMVYKAMSEELVPPAAHNAMEQDLRESLDRVLLGGPAGPVSLGFLNVEVARVREFVEAERWRAKFARAAVAEQLGGWEVRDSRGNLTEEKVRSAGRRLADFARRQEGANVHTAPAAVRWVFLGLAALGEKPLRPADWVRWAGVLAEGFNTGLSPAGRALSASLDERRPLVIEITASMLGDTPTDRDRTRLAELGVLLGRKEQIADGRLTWVLPNGPKDLERLPRHLRGLAAFPAAVRVKSEFRSAGDKHSVKKLLLSAQNARRPDELKPTDLYLMDRNEWVLESDLPKEIARLLIALTGGLVVDATHLLGQEINNLRLLQINA
jgi:hypothetical protein